MDGIIDSPENERGELEYASFWMRVAASFIDGLLLAVVFAFIFAALFLEQLTDDWKKIEELIFTQEFINFGYVTTIIGALYTIFMESSAKQATIGKMAMGIQVCNEYGERISVPNALIRYLAKNFFLLLLTIPLFSNLGMLFNFLYVAGCLLVIWDQHKQGLHDKLARTYVVLKKENEIII
jgi:uncharacterized RDD family membrane protein YckC